MKCIQESNISPNMRVLVRMDLDVPIEQGNIQEIYRLESGLETLKYIINKGAKPIIMGHMGQPKGNFKQELSTKQLLPYFNSVIGENTFEILENLRFDIREEENSAEFAKELAKQGDIYINESFATSHRKHTSIVAIVKELPSYAGFRLQKEITILDKVKKDAKKPFVVIIGGAKLESKKPVIDKFIRIADKILVGGKLGIQWDKEVPNNLMIPIDYAADQKDVGPLTIESFKKIIKEANTILWAGPLGMFEEKEFEAGTKAIIEAISQNSMSWSIAGGGDTITSINKLGSIYNFKFISTGGGAMLTYLAEDTLVGIEALNNG